MSKTFSADGDTDSRKAGHYTVTITLRDVADQRWYNVSLTRGGAFGVGALPVDGWQANYSDLDRARAEANRAVCVFRTGRSVEDVAEEYLEAAAVVNQDGYTYHNVSQRDITVAQSTMDLLVPLTLAQKRYDFAAEWAARPLVAA